MQSQDPTPYSFENFCNDSHDVSKVYKQLSVKLWLYNATLVLQRLSLEIEDVRS